MHNFVVVAIFYARHDLLWREQIQQNYIFFMGRRPGDDEWYLVKEVPCLIWRQSASRNNVIEQLTTRYILHDHEDV